MSARFLVKEGFSGLVRAKFPSFAAILTIAISLTLLGGGYIAGTEVYEIIKEVKSQFQVEVFLLPGATKSNKAELEKTLKDATGIDSYSFISKEKAAERFKQEFGEDIMEALGSNPLPESYTVKMDAAHQNYDAITALVNTVSKIPGVDDVQYRRGFLQVVERYFRAIAIAGGVILLLVLIGTSHAQKKYAVLIAGDYTPDDIQIPETDQWNEAEDMGPYGYDEFWNDTYLMWEMLVFEKYFEDENVYVLSSEVTYPSRFVT